MNAMITGANGRIGRAIAELFAENGYDLCLCGHSEKTLGQLRDFGNGLAEKYGIRSCIFTGDISDKVQCRRMVESAAESMGDADVLINNAGIAGYDLFYHISEEEHKRIMACNLDGTVFISQLIGKKMKKLRRGSIINISSAAGINGCPCAASYAASKGAVNAFTKSIAAELAPYGVRVNAVAPGMICGGINNLLSEEQEKNSCRQIAMGRFGTATEVAEAVLFLASERDSYITGTILKVDGGLKS